MAAGLRGRTGVALNCRRRIMLTVLTGLAEFKRELIRTRTGEGRARAKARGVKMGPTAKDDAALDQGAATPSRCWRTDA
jgi:DNA invertase Pin-like site-specific DNA recombinase